MANTIDKIIEIDSQAQKRLDAANELKKQFTREAKEKIAQTNDLIEEKTKQKLAGVRAEEEKTIEAQKRDISTRKEADILRLEQLYTKKHAELEDDLFRNVIGEL